MTVDGAVELFKNAIIVVCMVAGPALIVALAIGLVVDDAIVVVEAVEHQIEQGLSPRESTIRAMKEVSGPVIAIAVNHENVPSERLEGLCREIAAQTGVPATDVLVHAPGALVDAILELEKRTAVR